MDEIFVQARFSRDYKGTTFNDAIYYTQAKYLTLLPGEMEAEKDARFDAWKLVIDNIVKEPDTTEKVQAEVDDLKAKLADAEARLEELKGK